MKLQCPMNAAGTLKSELWHQVPWNKLVLTVNLKKKKNLRQIRKLTLKGVICMCVYFRKELKQ